MDDDTQRDEKVAMLIDALRLMASPSDVQLAVLPDFVAVPDEVALRVLDAFVVIHSTELSDEVQDAMRSIVDSVDRLPLESAEQWDPATLESAPYQELRRLASAALDRLGAVYEVPTMSGTAYVQGLSETGIAGRSAAAIGGIVSRVRQLIHRARRRGMR
jgi:hypothetical protein